MATKNKLFSYDDLEDADIDQFLKSLPPRQASKYIRIALRLLMKEMEGGNSLNTPTPPRTLQKTEKNGKLSEKKASEKEKTNKTESNYLDVNDIIKNLGK